MLGGQASGVLLWHSDIDEEALMLWRDRGLAIVAWTVNDAADQRRLAELGCPFMSDRVVGVLPELERTSS